MPDQHAGLGCHIDNNFVGCVAYDDENYVTYRLQPLLFSWIRC